MPTAPDRTYAINKVVPFYPAGQDQPERLRFKLPANKTYVAGQVMSENATTPGLADAVIVGDANYGRLLGIMEYDCFTDANGNVFKGTAANPEGVSTIGAPIWISGYFNSADLVGMAANVLALRAAAYVVHGSITVGVIKI